ncbi:hypothetical protein LTR10_024113 [Elasticomyces elasticus]|uniref:Copper transporter n=1 Tax=Exophiala sideris TaxID=1016849 RepID=A0ABR0JQ65_9EURO|nr:hypothetical protein LTR10_024113 [Elasticomyces elasticus]KAK5038318.1 hypothetical protein LTS07_001788 [Exophiala sideris]KAK5044302.1 hypothetical protein LTR13_000658 [Exophiala sideris]KAK5067802.1 hypothetical protein LTR69_001791 [Exophiala sideris]KAK5183958.1 hypothetical protein LTR44_003463 [Eurotiomycetes sp. CCFEE 6388]
MDSDTVIDGYNRAHDLVTEPLIPTTVIVDDPTAAESSAIINSYNKLHDLPNEPLTSNAAIVDDGFSNEPLDSARATVDDQAAATTVDEPSQKQDPPSFQKWLTPRMVRLVIELISFFAHTAITARYLTQSRTRKTAEHETCLASAMQTPCQTCLDNLHHCNAVAKKAQEGVVIGLDWMDIAAIIVLAFLWRAFLAASEKWLVARIPADKNKTED